MMRFYDDLQGYYETEFERNDFESGDSEAEVYSAADLQILQKEDSVQRPQCHLDHMNH